jgi:putative Ca2+/H+ antiporter (TMEM165/GDT1 family)
VAALLTSLLLTALTSFGDRPQLLSAVLAMRFTQRAAVGAGLLAATLANSLLSVLAGQMVHGAISEDPLQLFFAISLLFAGIGMVAWQRRLDILQGWRLSPFWTSFLGLFILQLGDKSQFILAANAARTGQWPWVLVGGFLGIMLGCLPALVLRERLGELLPVQRIRQGSGAVLLVIGAYLALSAVGLLRG